MEITQFPIIAVSPDAAPIRTKPRPRTLADKQFIREEVRKLLNNGVIVESQSSWRSQVVIVTQKCGKKRMCVDNAATVIRFTQIDAFPMPDIQELLSEIRGNCVFSKIDLKDAYHGLPILEEERKFTAFEADGKLYEFYENRTFTKLTREIERCSRCLEPHKLTHIQNGRARHKRYGSKTTSRDGSPWRPQTIQIPSATRKQSRKPSKNLCTIKAAVR